MLALAAAAKAVGTNEDALRGWQLDRARSRGVQRARPALAYAVADQPDRAATEGIDALESAQATKSDMTMRELKQLGLRLADCDAPQAAGFREALAAA